MLANFLIAGLLAGISARRGAPGARAAVAPQATRPFLGGAGWVGIGFSVFAAAAVLRIADLQLFRADAYLTRGAVVLQGDGVRRFVYNPRLAAIAATIPRGAILDRSGVLLAASDPAELARQRSDLVKLGASDLDDVPPDRPVRVYPFGGRTFHLLGDLRNRLNWRAGNTSFVERDSRVRLQGYDDFAGVVRVRQPDGTEAPQVIVDYRELVPLLRHRYQPEDPEVKQILGRDRAVRLTIDIRLQLATEEILKRYAAQAGFGAAAVVLDADRGDLLAAAAYPYPEHLPAEPATGPGGPLIDRARYGIYPPGSTFKLVTAIAAMRKDPALATKTFECKRLPDGREGNRVRGRLVHDDPTVTSPHGTVDLDLGIRHSCNAYFAQLATFAVGASALLETARLFGIPVAHPNTPRQLEEALPQAAYGQGQVIATPFQMARVAAALAASGKMPEGRWIQGDENPRSGPPVPVLDAAAAALLARSMRGVVTGGTAASYLAAVQPPIAGKTGTAEVQGKKSHSWFIGFAPYRPERAGAGAESDPGAEATEKAGATAAPSRRIAFAVIVEHGGYGGRLAAPAAGEIVRRAAALGLLRPDDRERSAP
jgi:peptidoglycan glycosyltransferase